jgi:hypothetical protein
MRSRELLFKHTNREIQRMSIFAGAAEPEWHEMSNYVVHFTKEYKGKFLYQQR